MNKKEIRLEAKRIKHNINFENISSFVQDKLYAINKIMCCDCIMLYKALADEVSIEAIYKRLKSEGKICCFPVVVGKNIVIRKDDGFVKGAFDIYEPCGDIINPSDVDVVIVPGVAFDKKCNRLGRGGGFYDRFLVHMSAFKIGVCPDSLLFDNIPSEQHDINVDMVVTEKRVIYNG